MDTLSNSDNSRTNPGAAAFRSLHSRAGSLSLKTRFWQLSLTRCCSVSTGKMREAVNTASAWGDVETLPAGDGRWTFWFNGVGRVGATRQRGCRYYCWLNSGYYALLPNSAALADRQHCPSDTPSFTLIFIFSTKLTGTFRLAVTPHHAVLGHHTALCLRLGLPPILCPVLPDTNQGAQRGVTFQSLEQMAGHQVSTSSVEDAMTTVSIQLPQTFRRPTALQNC